MALGLKKKPEPKLEDIGDDAIRDTVTSSRRRLAEILSLPRDEVLRMDMNRLGSEVMELHGTIESGEQLLDHRRARVATESWQSLPLELRRELKAEEQAREKRIRAREPLARAVQFIAKNNHYALRDAKLSIETLCGEDRHPSEAGLELVELVKRIKSQEQPLSDDERARYEFLVGVCIGNPTVFEQARERTALEKEAAKLADEITVAALDRRRRWEEPGSVTLPRYAVHGWLLDDGAREGDWTLMDVGLLVAVLGCFENEDARLFVGARFEGTGDERTLVVPGGVGSDIRLYGAIAGSPMVADGSGHVRVKMALATLRLQKWLIVEYAVGETRIRLAQRALALRHGRAIS